MYSTYGKSYFIDYDYKLNTVKDMKDKIDGENERFRVVIVEEGSGIFRIGDSKRVVSGNAVICLNEKEKVIIEKENGLKYSLIYFHPQIINSKFDFDTVHKKVGENMLETDYHDLYWLKCFVERENDWGKISLNPVTLNKLKQLFAAVENEIKVQYDDWWLCRSRSYFLELLFYIAKLYSKYKPKEDIVVDSFPDFIEDTVLYLHTNYKEKITLDILSREFNVNRTTLNEKFKKHIGDSVKSYLIKLRVNLASLMLRDTNISVKEISIRVGFNDSINFGRIFKKYKGENPTVYREKNSWLLNGCE